MEEGEKPRMGLQGHPSLRGGGHRALRRQLGRGRCRGRQQVRARSWVMKGHLGRGLGPRQDLSQGAAGEATEGKAGSVLGSGHRASPQPGHYLCGRARGHFPLERQMWAPTRREGAAGVRTQSPGGRRGDRGHRAPAEPRRGMPTLGAGHSPSTPGPSGASAPSPGGFCFSPA